MKGRLYEIAGNPDAIESTNPGDMVQSELYRNIDRASLLPIWSKYEQCFGSLTHPYELFEKSLLLLQFQVNTFLHGHIFTTARYITLSEYRVVTTSNNLDDRNKN